MYIYASADVTYGVTWRIHFKQLCYVWTEKQTKYISQVIKKKIEQPFLTANNADMHNYARNVVPISLKFGLMWPELS